MDRKKASVRYCCLGRFLSWKKKKSLYSFWIQPILLLECVPLHCEFPDLREGTFDLGLREAVHSWRGEGAHPRGPVWKGLAAHFQSRTSVLSWAQEDDIFSSAQGSPSPQCSTVDEWPLGCLKWLVFCDKIMKAATTLTGEIDTISRVLSTLSPVRRTKNSWADK